jgi:hypothetical protein
VVVVVVMVLQSDFVALMKQLDSCLMNDYSSPAVVIQPYSALLFVYYYYVLLVCVQELLSPFFVAVLVVPVVVVVVV